MYRSNANIKAVSKYSFWYRLKYTMQVNWGFDTFFIVLWCLGFFGIISRCFGVLPMIFTLVGIPVAFATAFLISVHKCVPYEG